MELKERLEIFKEELDLITKKDVRDFTKAVLEAAPDYIFEDCPSSSSGRYHPIDELGPDGNNLHVRKVFAVAYELSRGLDCEHNRDEICAAALLHDILKQGIEKSGHTVKNHPKLAADLIAEVYKNKFKDKIDRNSVVIIYNAIRHHYGPWTEKSELKPLSKYTPEELCLYISDYISSKRFVKVDYLKRNGLGFVKVNKEEDKKCQEN